MLDFPQVYKENILSIRNPCVHASLYAICIYYVYLYVSVSRVWYVYACIHALGMIYEYTCFVMLVLALYHACLLILMYVDCILYPYLFQLFILVVEEDRESGIVQVRSDAG